MALLAVLAFAANSPSSMARAQDPASLPVLTAVPVDTLSLPGPGLRGLVVGGKRLWMLFSPNQGLSAPETSFRSALVVLDRSTLRTDTLATEVDAYETGLARGPEFLWAGGSLLGAHASLFKIQPGNGRLLETLPAPGYHPGGLVWDGDHLWQVDCDARQLIRTETEEGKISRKFNSPGFYPTGLAYDGFHFWCADAATGRLYRLRSTNGRPDAVVDVEVFLRPGEFVTLAWGDDTLWVASASDPYLVRLDILR